MIMRRLIINSLLGLASVSMVTAAVVTMNHGEFGSALSTRVETRAVTSEGLYDNETEGAHLPGNAVYLKIHQDYTGSKGWEKDSAKFAFYFFAGSGDNKIEGWSNLLSYKYDDSMGGKIYEGQVPDLPSDKKGHTSWETMIGVRLDSAATSGNWGQKWNQTADLTIRLGETSTYRNEAEVYGAVDNSDKIYHVGSEERLSYFAWSRDWLKPGGNGSSCSSTDLNREDFEGSGKAWESAGSYFEAMGYDVKSKFSHATAIRDDGTATSPSLSDLAARYDFIYKKYAMTYGWSLSNWADRTIA